MDAKQMLHFTTKIFAQNKKYINYENFYEAG